jgi:hypothetical protein
MTSLEGHTKRVWGGEFKRAFHKVINTSVILKADEKRGFRA